VFGTAGVRGVFNSTQTPEEVYNIAMTSVFTFGKGTYGVGWDGRKSSSLLARVVAAGISAAGSEAVLFGMVPTPVTAYGSRERGCRIGFSVTASHNPPEYSGVKLFSAKGMELSMEDEERIERVLAVDVKKGAAVYGPIYQWNPLDQYVEAMVGRFGRCTNPMKIVIDCVNGPGALVTPRVLQELGHKVIPLNAQISWRFPSRMPEPTPQTLVDTASMVSGLGASFGFAHDGDADRLVMINSAGEVLPDSVVSIIALRALAKRSGVAILSENTSSAVEEEAANLGLRVVRSRIGKSFAEIEEESAIFASEPSKVVNPQWGMWEDGMYCAALITNAISQNPELLNLLSSERKWHYKQMNVQVSVDFQSVVGRVEAEFARFRIAEIRLLDGVKVIFKDQSWIMFRPSGTEPKVRIYCESQDQVRLGELLDVGNKLLQESGTMYTGGVRRAQ
jgi:phosphomannomutase